MTLLGFTRPVMNGYPNGIHEPVDLWRGDTWVLQGKLFGQAMVVQDLSAATVSWLLMDSNANVIRSFSIGSGVTLASDPTTGQLSIQIVDSPTIPSGGYWDRLIVTIAGVAQTFWVGAVRVHDEYLVIDDLDLAGLRRCL